MAEDELTQKKKLNPHVKFDEDGNDITSQYYEQQLQALPEHWIKKVDDKGRSGYYNTITDKFSFRRPGGRKKKSDYCENTCSKRRTRFATTTLTNTSTFR